MIKRVVQTVALIVCFCGRSLPAVAQMPFAAGAPPAPDDGKDLDEVEDVASEDEVLPLDDSSDPNAREKSAAISATQKDELALSVEELRMRHEYFTSLGIGSSKPWQIYSVEFASLLRDDIAFGFYAGSGDRHEAGIVEDKGYDLKIKARSAGITARYFLTRLERLSFEADLGYGTWDASLAPHGSDELVNEGEAKLTASFHGHGPIAGVSAVVTWLWESGAYLEWTPVGASWSKTLSRDFTRDSPLGQRAILRAIERGAFFGLTNLRVGYLF